LREHCSLPVLEVRALCKHSLWLIVGH
jgi:hypothetical protein